MESELIRASGGVYEIKVEGELIYSKKRTGEFPDANRIIADIRKKV